MTPNIRSLIGIVALLFWLALYALGVMQVGAAITRWPILLQTLFYVAAGVLWLLPCRPLLAWIGPVAETAEDEEEDDDDDWPH